MSRLTRRALLVGSAATVLLSACSPGEVPVAMPSGSTASGWPRTIDLESGPLTLDAQPQRIVVANAQFVRYDVLALGVKPVLLATSKDIPLTPWLEEAGAADLPSFEGDPPNQEKVASVNPDLIIDNTTADKSPYEGVAPLLGLSFEQELAPRLRLLARAVGREQRAEDVLSTIDQARAGWEPTWRPRSVTVFFGADTGPFVYLPASGPGYLLNSLGLPLQQRGRPADEFGFDLSSERIRELDADLVVACRALPHRHRGSGQARAERAVPGRARCHRRPLRPVGHRRLAGAALGIRPVDARGPGCSRARAAGDAAPQLLTSVSRRRTSRCPHHCAG